VRFGTGVQVVRGLHGYLFGTTEDKAKVREVVERRFIAGSCTAAEVRKPRRSEGT
jgi:hypothetical protein